MDRAIMLWIHAHASPALDAAFRFSHLLGTIPFCAALVAVVAAVHLARGERRAAFVWVVVGIASLAVPESIKLAVSRPRPDLWPWLVQVQGASFPSGHAVASAAFYPLLSWSTLRGALRSGRLAWALGFLPALFIGIGRCYLGVHWPSDVAAGWVLGAALSGAALRWLTPLSRARAEVRSASPVPEPSGRR